MQVRRLITVLNKMIEKDPYLAYAPVAIYPNAFKSDYFACYGLSEHQIGEEFMEWDNGVEVDERKPRPVLVLGVDEFRCDFKL